MQYERSQQKIKKTIQRMSGKYSRYNIFRDFIVLAACTISNSVDKQQWKKREKMYMETIAKYTKNEADKFTEMLTLMILAYDSRMGDFIGELYMTMEFGNKHSGQFFTPYHVSKLMSNLVYEDKKDERIITLNEPTCGSGGMIVAFAEAMKANKRNYQTDLRVICQDIDYDVVKMCYIQLSLLGIDAVIYQGNTLTLKMNEVWYTPMHLINKMREKQQSKNNNSKKMLNALKRLEVIDKPTKKEPEPVFAGPPGQMNIFDYINQEGEP